MFTLSLGALPPIIPIFLVDFIQLYWHRLKSKAKIYQISEKKIQEFLSLKTRIDLKLWKILGKKHST